MRIAYTPKWKFFPRHASRSRTYSRGYTLTEVLVVFAIVGALAALIIPLSRSMIAKGRQATCLGNLKQIGIAIESYLQDHNDIMPNLDAGRSSKNEDVPVMDNTFNQYLSSEDVFRCPEDKVNFQQSGSSYLWNSTQSGRSKHRLVFFGINGDSSRIPLVTDKESWHPGESGVNILYADYSASKEFKFRTSP